MHKALILHALSSHSTSLMLPTFYLLKNKPNLFVASIIFRARGLLKHTQGESKEQPSAIN